jgi:hypothetical protein
MKFNLNRTTSFSQHRAGWSYAMSHLMAYHSSAGLFVDDFIEKTFSWELDEYYKRDNTNNLPYRFPWVGIIHNPPSTPDWFYRYHNPESILNRKIFKDSLKHCKCIVTLSEYLANWIRPRLDGIPVVSVKHPTPIPNKLWDYRKFLRNKKNIIQLGYWLRDFDSICRLKVPNGWSKHIMPSDDSTYKILMKHREASSEVSPHEDLNKWVNTNILDRLSNEEFDERLSYSLVYLNLYDSSANNAVIECVARNTPLIVNRIPAVIEYLGPNYPLYFETEEEATSLLFNAELIYRAHIYLSCMNKDWMRGEFFAMDFHNKVKECVM